MVWKRTGKANQVSVAASYYKEEAAFADRYGVEALEQRFEKHEIDYVDPHRRSVA